MVLISNQILIDFLRLNHRGVKVRNEQLGKQLDAIIISLGGRQVKEVSCGRDNEVSNSYGYPKRSMSYDFPKAQLSNLFTHILKEIL